jgi:hypothetical protein
MHKEYLGDGVYVDWNGYALILTTENGIRTTNCIELEADVYTHLTRYVEHLGQVESEKESERGEE